MTNFIRIAAVTAAVVMSGCRTTTDTACNDRVVTNTVSFASFQDESYVWETWSYGTNRADKADIR